MTHKVYSGSQSVLFTTHRRWRVRLPTPVIPKAERIGNDKNWREEKSMTLERSLFFFFTLPVSHTKLRDRNVSTRAHSLVGISLRPSDWLNFTLGPVRVNTFVFNTLCSHVPHNDQVLIQRMYD